MPPVTLPIAAAAVSVVALLNFGDIPDPTRPTEGHPFGVSETLPESGGAVASYTVTQLGPSDDPVRYPLTGRLFQATVSVAAVEGSVTPKVSMFYARAAAGPTYPVLGEVTTAHGIDRGPLLRGERATGRIYFDVVADTPNSVVCNNGMADLMVWVGRPESTPAPPPAEPRNPTIPVMLHPETNPVPA